jgi:hypothetical protein
MIGVGILAVTLGPEGPGPLLEGSQPDLPVDIVTRNGPNGSLNANNIS